MQLAESETYFSLFFVSVAMPAVLLLLVVVASFPSIVLGGFTADAVACSVTFVLVAFFVFVRLLKLK